MLADVTLSCDELSTEARRMRRIKAQFFHICVGVFDALLAAGKDRTGILGDASNYDISASSTNGTGMHSLVWLAGNLEFFTVRLSVFAGKRSRRRM
jgi:hypothetical protein